MPIIEVTLLEGRTFEKKASMMKAVTDAVVETLEVPRESVRVIIYEVPPEHFAVGGVPKRVPPGG